MSVIFFMKGSFQTGYTINKKEHFQTQLYTYNPIGAYGATFNKRAIFIYKTKTLCEGYFIRKRNWVKVINNPEYADISTLLKEQLETNYLK